MTVTQSGSFTLTLIFQLQTSDIKAISRLLQNKYISVYHNNFTLITAAVVKAHRDDQQTGARPGTDGLSCFCSTSASARLPHINPIKGAAFSSGGEGKGFWRADRDRAGMLIYCCLFCFTQKLQHEHGAPRQHFQHCNTPRQPYQLHKCCILKNSTLQNFSPRTADELLQQKVFFLVLCQK